MSKFYISDGVVRIYGDAELTIVDSLPTATYTLSYDSEFNVMRLIETQDMIPPDNLYGNIVKNTDHIINTFFSVDENLGVLLTGMKGAGKSATIKYISQRLLQGNVPTIVVNTAIDTYMMTNFLKKINQRVLVVFDEFDKIFRSGEYEDMADKRPSQMGLLSLLDGTESQQQLFIFACNDIQKVNRYMCNRPSRIRYRYKYDSLPESAIREYCESNLNSKDKLNDIIAVSTIIKEFSFDILKTLVNELDMYNVSVKECLSYMNIVPDQNDDTFRIVSTHLKTGSVFTKTERLNLHKNNGYTDYVMLPAPGSKTAMSENDDEDSVIEGVAGMLSASNEYKFWLNKSHLVSIHGDVYTYRDAEYLVELTIMRIDAFDSFGDAFDKIIR